jgi:hypothetical protein
VISSSSALRLDVVAAHSSLWDKGALDRFRSGMSIVVERVEQSLRAEYPSVQLQSRCVTAEQACTLRVDDVTCAVTVLDVPLYDERLALFSGRLQGAHVPCIVACHTDASDAAQRLGLNNPDLVTYASMDDLFLADSMLQRELLRAVPQARIHKELLYRFWFPRETSSVWVVCPQIHNPGEFAHRSNPDYTYLDNLGDTDALLEVMVFLSQHYPNATIERFCAGDLPNGHTSGNLVVIGGPGSAGEISNEICKEMMSEMRSHVSYSLDCEQMTVAQGDGTSLELRAEYRNDGQDSDAQEPRDLRRDRGYFARFGNPLNENATVVLINGIHTAGVLGAARAFSERREALRNFLAVLAAGAETMSFESHFDVQVLNGQVRVPSVKQENVLSLGRKERPTAPTTTSTPLRAPTADVPHSVRVLFIVGDRGGSQVSQAQTPNEYHAIQTALRGSEHRDIVGLANPILGATRERLAVAYRERPAIVHFAGHGNSRSLSIIEDRGSLVNETPLDADQLCGVLKAMEKRARLCVLNACMSAELAQRLVQAHAVDHAIGWPATVSDSAAIAFSRALYGALGDGRSIADAVDVGIVACGPDCKPVFVAGPGADSPLFTIGEDEWR